MRWPDEKRIRYERKFAVADTNRAEVERLIKSHPAIFREIYHRRSINNIYFDTLDGRHLRDSIEGATYRLKVRIRWYGELFCQIAKPVLEFKWKHGLMVSKDSFPLDPFELARGMSFDRVVSLLRTSDVPDTFREEILRVRPVVVNRYVRKYFLSSDKRFRVTIDDGLCYYRVQRFANAFLDHTADVRHVIVEMKYSRADDVDADRVSRRFPFRVSRWSKFVAGMDRGYEG